MLPFKLAWRLARRVAAACGSASPLRYIGLPEDDPRRRCPDVTRARDLLGWEPVVQQAEGLARTVAWFAEQVGQPLPERADVVIGSGAGLRP